VASHSFFANPFKKNQVEGYFLYREKYLTLPRVHGACMCEGPPYFFHGILFQNTVYISAARQDIKNSIQFKSFIWTYYHQSY